ncbi:uncharacterized protein JCM10292_004403 [Rhodotorula paludigena]|uniref:uncharacterized protein n=1 Tax=Rhodotorula paludigena TaxID=86838 RepID=UPI00317E846E
MDPAAELSLSSPLPDHLDDLAATTLAERHQARRQRELEWDERDTAQRRLRAIRRSLVAESGAGPPDDVLPVVGGGWDSLPQSFVRAGADDEHEEDDLDETDEDEPHARGFSLLGLPGDYDHEDDDNDEGDDDSDTDMSEAHADPSWMRRSRQFADSATIALHNLLGEHPLNPSSSPPPHSTISRFDDSPPLPSPFSLLARDPSSALSYTSFLQPGTTFVGEQTFGRRARLPTFAARQPVRPATSTAPATVSGRAAELYSTDWDDRAAGRPLDSSTAHPAFAPQSPVPSERNLPPSVPRTSTHDVTSESAALDSIARAYRDLPILPSSYLGAPHESLSDSLAIPRPASTSSGAAPASGSRSESSPLLALLRARPVPSTRYAPYGTLYPSSSGPPATAAGALSAYQSVTDLPAPTATHPRTAVPAPAPSVGSAAERARARIAQTANPAARASRSSWMQVADELRSRTAGGGGAGGRRVGPVERAWREALAMGLEEDGWDDEEEEMELEYGADGGVGKGARGEEQERWNVKVTIHSYSPEQRLITGLMRAYGVAIPPPACSHDLSTGSAPVVGDVTTFFHGTILHPILDGIFCSPSPTGADGKFRVTRATEAASWIRLGPFRGMTKAELLDKAKNRSWVEEKTRGWILFRWKEKDFVNVTAKESTLSISGFYHCALNRQTGEIEGLYHDPLATPHQHLVLSPADNDRGAFSLGTFALC